VLLFLLGTLKSDSIKQAFPWCCRIGYDYPLNPLEWTWSGSALLFWAFALVWMGLYRQRLKAESQQAAVLREQTGKLVETVGNIQGGTTALQDATKAVSTTVADTATKANELAGKIDQINDAVQTLPPQNYVTALGEYTHSCHTLCGGTTPRQAHTGDTKADLEPIIRKLLRTMALLAETYDGEGSRYAANVMYFVPSTHSEFQTSDVQKCLSFLPVPAQPGREEAPKGALVLRKSMTAVANADADDEVVETAFPILDPYLDDKGKFRVLPGAPRAYAQSQNGRQPDVLFYYFLDLWTIGNQLRAEYAFDDTVIAKIEEEYDKRKHGRWVRSGLSFPLFEVEAAQEKVIGVLNIHCNREHMLGGFKTQTLFARTTVHFVNDIAEATGLWLKLA